MHNFYLAILEIVVLHEEEINFFYIYKNQKKTGKISKKYMEGGTCLLQISAV